MTDQLSTVPMVQRISGILGDNHCAIIGMVSVNSTQIKRDLGRGR